MFSVADIKTRYRVAECTVLGWIHTGQLKAINAGRTPNSKKPRWRVTQAALDAFEASRTATAEAPRARRQKPADVVAFYA